MNMKFLLSLLLSSVALAAPAVTAVEPRELVQVESRDTTPVEARELEARAVTQIRFDTVTASGAGCGSITSTYSSTRNTVTVGFSTYQATIPGTTIRECVLTIKMTYPSGCTSGSLRSDYHGYVQTDSGASGRVGSSYSMTVGNNHTPPDSVFSGAAWVNGGNYAKIDVSPAKLINRSANDASVTLTVRTKLTAARTSGTATAQVSLDDITFQIINQSRNPAYQTCVV